MLKPIVGRYQGKVSRIYFRADLGYANPEVYEYLEGDPAPRQPCLTRTDWPLAPGRGSGERSAPFLCELYPHVGFIVTDMARPAANFVAFYNKRRTGEQWIKEGKGAI